MHIMNAQPDLAHSHTVAAILADLQRAGVTDIVSNTPFNWFEAPKKVQQQTPPKPVTAKTKPAPRPQPAPKQKIIEATPKEEIPTLTPQTHMWDHTVTEATAHILTGGLPTQKECFPFTEEEATLLSNMLQSIGFTTQATSTTAIQVADTDDIPYPMTALMPLSKAYKAPEIPLIIFGQVAARVFTGQQEASLTDLREAAQAGKFDQHSHVIITYHPRTLLKQPALKQLVWHDFCSYLARKES